jgi:dTDP-4-dehydrorhamnose 3,5-epimerase
MPFIKTDFPGLLIFEPAVFNDSRGYFFESYNQHTCEQAGVDTKFIQDNQAKSVYGVVRGLHYQLNPFSQTKFIRALTGSILDVVVDLRKGSPTFGKHFSIELSAENKKQLYIPQGFAHGYSVLSETAEVFYKCDAFYNKEAEAGIQFYDPMLAIDWRIPVDQQIISDKDKLHPTFENCKNNFIYTQS